MSGQLKWLCLHCFHNLIYIHRYNPSLQGSHCSYTFLEKKNPLNFGHGSKKYLSFKMIIMMLKKSSSIFLSKVYWGIYLIRILLRRNHCHLSSQGDLWPSWFTKGHPHMPPCTSESKTVEWGNSVWLLITYGMTPLVAITLGYYQGITYENQKVGQILQITIDALQRAKHGIYVEKILISCNV